MSKDLTNVRKEASLINSYVKQEKLLPAITALKNLLVATIGANLMRAEKVEIEKLIDTGTYSIMSHPRIKAHFPMDIRYNPDKERDLLDTINIVLDAFNDDVKNEANALIQAEIEEKKKKHKLEIEKSILKYKEGNTEAAIADFEKFSAIEHTTAEDFASIAEAFLHAKDYKNAAVYYEKALALQEDNADWLNTLAMLLRKTKNFEKSEESYFKLAKIAGKSPSLFFNFARLYLDWNQLDKALKAGQAAVKFSPDFEEAKKLVKYIEKQQSTKA